MTTIGFIGSGNIGGTVARLAVAAGYDVVMSNSRGPETLSELVADLGPRASAGTVEDAARHGRMVVVSIPLYAYSTVPPEPLAGKIVMDTMNYYPGRDGHIAGLDDDSTTSSELLQKRLTGSKVVKVFNNIQFKHLGSLARPAGASDRSTLVVSGDDPQAKEAVAAFLDAIGYDALDNGSLAQGGRQHQPGKPAHVLPYSQGQGAPVSRAELRQALDAG